MKINLHNFKKFLGFSTGDPSVPDTLNETWELLYPIIKRFYEIDGSLNNINIENFLKIKKKF